MVGGRLSVRPRGTPAWLMRRRQAVRRGALNGIGVHRRVLSGSVHLEAVVVQGSIKWMVLKVLERLPADCFARRRTRLLQLAEAQTRLKLKVYSKTSTPGTADAASRSFSGERWTQMIPLTFRLAWAKFVCTHPR